MGHLPRYPGLGRFLLGRAFYTDAANTVIVFLIPYTVNEIGFTETGAQVLLLAAITAAVVGGLILGRVVDRIGPQTGCRDVPRSESHPGFGSSRSSG